MVCALKHEIDLAHGDAHTRTETLATVPKFLSNDTHPEGKRVVQLSPAAKKSCTRKAFTHTQKQVQSSMDAGIAAYLLCDPIVPADLALAAVAVRRGWGPYSRSAACMLL